MAVKTFSAGEVLTASDTNTYLANAGLVYITQSTMGNTTSVSNCFSATYSHYRLILTYNISTSAALQMRLRTGSGDDTSANYKWIYVSQSVTSSTTSSPSSISGWNDTSFYLSNTGNGGSDSCSVFVDIYNPNKAVKTMYNFQTVFEWSSGEIYNRSGGGQFNGTTQFTGFSLLGSATTTGTVAVYGWRIP